MMIYMQIKTRAKPAYRAKHGTQTWLSPLYLMYRKLME